MVIIQSETGVAIAISIAILFVVPAVSTLSAWFTHGDWYLMDEGTILYAAYRSSLGELPHTEIPYFYTGGLEILLGIVFRIFGSTFAVARWTLGVNMALTAALTYLISRKLSVGKTIAACFAVIATTLAYGMNFHIYPAWYGSTCLLLALLFMWNGLQTGERRWLLVAGVCLGVASSMKQTSGIYGLFAFVLSVLLLSGGLFPLSVSKQPTKKTNVTLAVLAATPIATLIFFVILLRSQLTLLNVIMFLGTPLIVIAFTLRTVMVMSRSHGGAERFVSETKMVLLPVFAGFALGFLPVALIYAVQGNLGQFVGDSFINIQQAFAHRYSVFKFVEDEATSNPFVFVRWLTLFVIPIAAALIGFLYSIRNGLKCGELRLLLLLSVLIAFSYFTLYPIAIRMYVLFLLPLVTISAAYFAGIVLSRLFGSTMLRVSTVISIFVLVAMIYLGARSFSGDLDVITTTKVGLLNQHAGNALVSQETIDYLRPVLGYIEHRPTEESFVGFDVFQKLIAFVTRKKIQTDYLQRHYFNEITPDDFAALKHLAEDRKIDIVVIGRRYLSGSQPEQSLFDYLNSRYDLALDNQTHLVYQRIPK